MILKFVFGLLLSVSVVFSRPEEYPPPELFELIDPLHEACTQKLGVTDDEVKNYDISDKSKKMMCYMKCLMVEARWAKPDETINYDYITETAHPKIKDILLPALEKCREIPSGEEECEKSYNFNACLQKADPVHYFLP
ncbi:hypothetical protein ILUMI_06645 [Ignelater luminosus]|uniref:Uncharacterized protein n=1 Tax=Ignelater luminosus TaxID=2038154 RepID=A0A8K0D5C3_IGNLU|nr:hypothetical protein ILUMI_06645 [Ignelater luminosus]